MSKLRFAEGVSIRISTVVVVIVIAVAVAGGYVALSSRVGEERPPPTLTLDVLVEPSLSALDRRGATASSVSRLVEGANEFAFRIYRKLDEDDRNTFFSPYSVHICLSMLYEGAKGETAEEMREVLELPEGDKERRAAFAELQKELMEKEEVKLKIANAAWPQRGIPFYEEYLETVQRYYLARVEALDFSGDLSGAARRINEWAAAQTEGKIKEIVREWDLKDTLLLLANAIYFKGDWLIQFDESLTGIENFYLPDGSITQVPMMRFHWSRLMKDEFLYAETEDLQVLRLFYSGRGVSMTFLLPKDGPRGIGWLRDRVDWKTFKVIEGGLKPTKMGNIQIPKFEVSYFKNLKPALRELGITSAFDPGADFSGISPLPMWVKVVAQRAYVRVDEVGTEAAAVTAVGAIIGPGPVGKTFIANRPFMFVIKDETTGYILFIGSIVNPQLASQG